MLLLCACMQSLDDTSQNCSHPWLSSYLGKCSSRCCWHAFSWKERRRRREGEKEDKDGGGRKNKEKSLKKTFMWLCGCQVNISKGGTLQLKEVWSHHVYWQLIYPHTIPCLWCDNHCIQTVCKKSILSFQYWEIKAILKVHTSYKKVPWQPISGFIWQWYSAAMMKDLPTANTITHSIYTWHISMLTGSVFSPNLLIVELVCGH